MGSEAGFGGLKFEDEIDFHGLHHHPNFTNGYKLNDPSFDLDFKFGDNSIAFSSSSSSMFAPSLVPNFDGDSSSAALTVEGDSPSDDIDFSEAVLSYISQMLMEEDMEEKPCMFHDPLALQAAEKSLYDVLGEKHPSSPDQYSSFGDQFLVDCPDDGFSSCFSDYCSNSSSSNTSSSAEQQLNKCHFGESKSLFSQTPLPTNFVFQSAASSRSKQPPKSEHRLAGKGNYTIGSFDSNLVLPNLFSDGELALQFQRGVEEANRFLPKSNQLIIDLETNVPVPETKEKIVVKEEKEEREHSPNPVKGKKNREREIEELDEERSNKQSAVYFDEVELAEIFDKVLVCTGNGCRPPGCILGDSSQSGSTTTLQQSGQSNGSNEGKTRTKREGKKKDVVDLRTLLILCAQAVSSDDRRTANELLGKIRQHSSPSGDGSQRLAHCFANALQARLAGTGTQIYTALSYDKVSAADMLKAYLSFISACPFYRIANIFANHNILDVSQHATTLHIIDFGVLYGFQWPPLIYRLARRQGGPPKLRITGIELPQSGFRPGERVQQTGRRLAKYCELHKVPFEHNAIAKKWETIEIDDLKLKPGEFVVVNCLFRSKNLLDETVVVNSPKNAVLNLIQKIKPEIFIHGIVNGLYNAPFFVTRFREALFHFSALFDIFDANMSREDQMRFKFEKEFFGREALNVIACEGSERVERPETYKQWQIRSMRAGLKQLPLDPQLMNKLKSKVMGGYHGDFVVNQDGGWLLQGWKGRIIYASSAWAPV